MVVFQLDSMAPTMKLWELHEWITRTRMIAPNRFLFIDKVAGLERWTHNFRFQDDPREYDSWENGISI